jgi:23S rRNA (adenine2503-C2)-methyltransferase
MGLSRHLTEAEVFGQAARFSAALRQRGERLSNVVLMGMGEPLHNYDAAVGAMRRIQADLGIGARHITVSTVGIVPGIDRLAEEGLQVTLAVSLHAATDAERDALLPVNRRWPLADLIAACRRYAVRTGRRISFEWALIAGRTDGAAQATALADLLGDLPAHVNCIPLNPTRGYDGGPSTVAEPFLDVLRRRGVPATVRVRRGIDIEAGCGQLQAEVRRRRGGAA